MHCLQFQNSPLAYGTIRLDRLTAPLPSTLHWTCHALLPQRKAGYLFRDTLRILTRVRCSSLVFQLLVTQACCLKRRAFSECLLQCQYNAGEARYIGLASLHIVHRSINAYETGSSAVNDKLCVYMRTPAFM